MASGFGGLGRDVSAYVLLIVGIATLGPVQFGFHLGELNAPQDVISCKTQSSPFSQLFSSFSRSKTPSVSVAGLPQCIPMENSQFAMVSSIFTAGGLVGALTSGPLTSAKGRLMAMRLTAMMFILGSLVETLAGSIPVLAIGRFLVGVGAGGSTVIVPLYISEVSPPAKKGFFGAFTQIGINVGTLLVQTLGFLLSYGSAWRWILAAGVFIAAGQAVGSFIMPESPVWLATTKGDVTTARRTLQRLRGHGARVDDEVDSWGAGEAEDDGPSEEAALLSHGGDDDPESSKQQTGDHLGFLQVLKDPHTRPAIIAVVGIMFAQQLCGINSIIMYSVKTLDGLLPINSALLTILMSVINLVTTIGASPLPDRLGRKSCLLLSIAGQGISSLVLALSIVYNVKILTAISVLVFVAFFAAGLGPVPFILASELVGQEAVGATQSWSLSASYIASFLVAQFFPIVDDSLNNKFGGAGWVYFIFAGLALVCAAFVTYMVPETLGKKDVDEVWGRNRRID